MIDDRPLSVAQMGGVRLNWTNNRVFLITMASNASPTQTTLMSYNKQKYNISLKDIESFNDSKFLEFLYAECSRVRSQESNAGWTMWAIVGSLFALVCYCYDVLKGCVGRVDFSACYYVFSVFFPISLYINFLAERINAIGIGDTVHLARVKDSKSKSVLLVLLLISLVMIIFGFWLLCDKLVIGYWCAILLLVVVSFSSMIYNRNRYINTFDMFVVSDSKRANMILITLMGGVLLLPSTQSMRYLEFGFSTEFEIAIAGVLIVCLIYFLLNKMFVENKGNQIDELIDNYLYKNWNKQKVIRRLESIYLGSRPVDEMMDLYDSLVDMIAKIPTMEQKIQKIAEIAEKGICPIDSESYFVEMERCLAVTKNYSDAKRRFLDKVDELMHAGTVLKDEDFVAMLDSVLFDKNLLKETEDQIHCIQEQIEIIITSIKTSMSQCELCKDICDKNNKEK